MLHGEFGLVSIIMAAYNAEKTIELAIESVLNQTYSNFELLVINDCSKDGTAKLVEDFSAKDNRVRLISNEKNSGVSFTRKHGLEEANGSWIAILDSDDAWAPEKLGKQIAGLINIFNPELVIIGGTLSLTGDYITQPIKTAVRKYSLNLVNKDSAIMTSKLKDKAGIVGACMLARSRMFES